MKNRLLTVSLIAVVVAGTTTLLSGKVADWTSLSDTDIRAVRSHVFSAGLAMLMVALLAFDKAGTEVIAQEWARSRMSAIKTVRMRLVPARESIRSIRHLAKDDDPKALPETAAADFDRLAQFCSGWISADVESVWEDSERSVLVSANRRIFEFLLTLEVGSKTDTEKLEETAGEATRALDQVEKVLGRALRR